MVASKRLVIEPSCVYPFSISRLNMSMFLHTLFCHPIAAPDGQIVEGALLIEHKELPKAGAKINLIASHTACLRNCTEVIET